MTADSGRTVLTTGVNSGVGLATVVHLATLGFQSVGSVRSQAKAACAAEAAACAAVTVETVVLDVTDAERCRAVVDQAPERARSPGASRHAPSHHHDAALIKVNQIGTASRHGRVSPGPVDADGVAPLGQDRRQLYR